MDDAKIKEMVLCFDPTTCDCEATRAVFRLPIATKLYLLWRQNHIVSQYFSIQVLETAARIAGKAPQTAEELVSCFRTGSTSYDFVHGDVERFCERALPYFTGELSIGFRIESPVAEEG